MNKKITEILNRVEYKNSFCKVLLLVVILFGSIIPESPGQAVQNTKSEITSEMDFKLSPYTGYTRKHWIEVTEKIIAGVLPYLNPETGLPDLSGTLKEKSFENIRQKRPEEAVRELERIMMAVVIYTTATGKDNVSGYDGSISAPFLKAVTKGTDPDDSSYWGEPQPNDQIGSIFSMGVYLNPKVFWDPLTAKQKTNILNYLQKQTYNKTYNNNHYFFHMIPVALLEANGMKANQEHLTKMFQRLLGWYRGNGWYIDGNNQGFDKYNLWGFQLYSQVLMKFNQKWHDQFSDTINFIGARFFETLPYQYGRDGGPIPWGRSLSYRFADISAIAWAEINGNCTLAPGQARRIASGELKYFIDHGCIGSNNLLNIGYWGANASVAESYISPGDPYWATQGLACLLIPEDDPFWTAKEEPIPADGAGGKMAVNGAQFALRVSSIDGEARMFPAGQPFSHSRDTWQNGAKYDQNAYSSYLGFCTSGEGGAEIGAGRTGYSFDGETWYYREKAEPITISEDHIVSRYRLITQPYYDVLSHTLIGNDGEVYVFMHNYPDPIYLYLGGYGIQLQNTEDLKSKLLENQIQIGSEKYHSILRVLNKIHGELSSETLIPREGWNDSHLFGGFGAFPYWKSKNPIPPNTPVIIYSNGTRNRLPVIPEIIVTKNQGNMTIQFEGEIFKIDIPF